MTIAISDYIQVDMRAAELGCRHPTNIAILPENFESVLECAQLVQRSEAATVRTLFRTNGLMFEEFLPASVRVPFIQNNGFEWVGPTLFISSALISNDPAAISNALNVLANYVTDFFKGTSGEKKVKLNIVVERHENHICKKITYEGSVDGLKQLSEIIKDVANE